MRHLPCASFFSPIEKSATGRANDGASTSPATWATDPSTEKAFATNRLSRGREPTASATAVRPRTQGRPSE
jgi:hypothetical protein